MDECDLIMKGGVTSGVAYPGAVARLAKRFRFRNIGGTSAGAIAAVLAGAAEYRRQRSEGASDRAGFDALEALAPELGSDLEALFQPEPALQPLYEVLLAVATTRTGESRFQAGLIAVIKTFALLLILTALPGVLIAGTALSRGSWALGLLGVLLALLIPAIILAMRIGRLVGKNLVSNDFGLCTGLTTRRGRREGQRAFTDWVHEHIESVAGPRDPARTHDAPLTVGDLAQCDIYVASVTTDLSSRRPWRLPLQAGAHAFSVAEVRRLLPAAVLDHLVDKGNKIDHADDALPDDLWTLPDGSDMPLVLLARLSLSFPGLVSAVPLYRQDHGLPADAEGRYPWRRCLFSDGGISSNFPIHFFDALLPSRPTFGIAFARLDAARHGSDEASRVDLPVEPPSTLDAPVYPASGITGFLASIVTTAKDWQDTLQSQVTGYAERIVEIRLDPDKEGGLHVNMDEATITKLSGLGVRAAAKLDNTFDFDEHRYRRALTLLPTLDAALERLSENYRKRGIASSGLDYDDILTTYGPKFFDNEPAWREDPLARLALALVSIGDASREREECENAKSFADGNTPDTDTELRLVASTDAGSRTRQA